MGNKSKNDEAAKEAMETLQYVKEQTERVLESLRRKTEAREVKRLVVRTPLPKSA